MLCTPSSSLRSSASTLATGQSNPPTCSPYFAFQLVRYWIATAYYRIGGFYSLKI